MSQDIILRFVRETDRELLYRWANDPVVLATSYSSSEITWSEHQRWFEEKLNDPGSLIYIAEEDSEPIGQIRFEKKGVDVTVSVIVDSAYRGSGYGSKIIETGSRRALDHKINWDEIIAWIKKSNKASKRAFQKAGYKLLETTEHRGTLSYRMVFGFDA